MVMARQELARSLAGICRDALDGKITLEQFYERWPPEAAGFPLCEEVYADLEDGIEHTPGYFLKKGIDHSAWRNSAAYTRILIDFLLLGRDRSFEDLLDCRKHVVEYGDLSDSELEGKIDACLNAREARN